MLLCRAFQIELAKWCLIISVCKHHCEWRRNHIKPLQKCLSNFSLWLNAVLRWKLQSGSAKQHMKNTCDAEFFGYLYESTWIH